MKIQWLRAALLLQISVPTLLPAQSGADMNQAIPVRQGSGNNYQSNTTVWYVFTPDRDCRVEISTCGYAYPRYITAFQSPSLTDSVETFHNSCPGSSVDRDLAFFYATNGHPYYIRWVNPLGGVATSFSWTLTEAALSPGETCNTALPLALGTNATGKDYLRWYVYTPGITPEKIDVRSCGSNTFYSQIRFACGDNDFERSAKHMTCEASTTTQFEALPGMMYYLKVYPTLNPSFTVTKSDPVQGEVCSNPFIAVEGINHADHSVNTDQWYVYHPACSGTVCFQNIDLNNAHELRFNKRCGEAAFAVNQVSTAVKADTALYILIRNRDSQVYDWTLTLIPDTGHANLALNKPVTASSTEGSTYDPSRANDGSLASRWSSAFCDPQWFTVDLGKECSIDTVVIRWEAASAKTYHIEVSPDNTTWTMTKSVSNGSGGITSLAMSKVRGRYVRFYGLERNTEYGYSFWEFEVYGSSTVGENELSRPGVENIRVFPNPCRGDLFIPLDQEADFSVLKVFDLSGNPVMQRDIRGQHGLLHADVGLLSSGAYLLKITGPAGTVVTRFIKR